MKRILALLLVLVVVLAVPVNALSLDLVNTKPVEVGVFHDIWGGTWHFMSDGTIVVEKDGENLTLNMLGSASTLLAGLSKLHVSQARLHVVNKTFCVFTVQLPSGGFTYYIKWSTLMPRAKITIKAKIPMVSGLFGKRHLAFKMLSLQPKLSHVVAQGSYWLKGKHLYFSYKDVLHAVSKHRNKGWRLLGSSVNGLIFSVSSENIVIDPEIGYTEGDISWTAYAIDWSDNRVLLDVDTSSGAKAGATFSIYVYKPVHVDNVTVSVLLSSYDSSSSSVTVTIKDAQGNVIGQSTVSPVLASGFYVTVPVDKTLAPGTYTVSASGSGVTGLGFKAGSSVQGLTSVLSVSTYSGYYYYAKICGYPPIEGSITKHYVSYSSDNTTYTYYYSPEYTIVRVPGGEEIVSGSYSILGTNNGDTWINMTGDVTTTAWNRIYSITTDKSLYGHGQTIQVNVTVVDEYGDPVSGENVTVWAGVSQYPYNVTLSLTNIMLAGNQTLAPHLDVWSFDGEDDYILVNDNAVFDSFPLTLTAEFRITNTGTGQYILSKTNYGGTEYAILTAFTDLPVNLRVYYYNGTNTVYAGSSKTQVYETNKYTVSIIYDNPIEIYVNGQMDNQLTPTYSFETVTNSRVTIGARYPDAKGLVKGNIYYAFIHTRSLSITEISNTYNNHIINASGLVLFLDPTFYNGTHFIDLSGNGNHGTPYGGVQRVPAEQRWLWLVTNATSDNLVHLRYFPIGTIVKFVNATDGTVVREVFIDSDDVAVSLPSGTYNVTAIITYGDYYQTTATTDSNGVATVNFTAPDYDAYVIIQAETVGGVKNTTVKVTDIAYSYTYNETVYKNDVDELKLSAWHTLDTSPVQGSFAARNYWGNTTVADINNGQGVWQIPTNKSGSYSFFIDWVYDAENEIAKQVDKTEYYQVAGLNTQIESNQQLYAMINSELQLNLTCWYDDGYVIYPNTTANVTITREFPDHTETVIETHNLTNGQLLLTINVTTEETITVTFEIQDFGNYTAIATWTIPVDAILLENIETVGDYDHSELTAKLKTRSGLVGYYEGALFILDDQPSDNIWEIGVEGDKALTYLATLETNRVFYNLTDTIELTLQLLNYNASIRTYNVSVQLVQPYVGVIGEANTTLTIYANSAGETTLPITITTDRSGYCYANITVTDGTENLTWYGILPALIGYSYPENYSIIKIVPFSSEDFSNKKLVTLTVENIKPSGEPWFALPIINNVLLTTLAEIQRYNVSELARVNATIAVPDEILESGDTVKINVTLASEFPIETTVYVYAEDSVLFYNDKFTITNNTLSLDYTIPRLQMNTLETITVTVYVYNNWNGKLIGYDQKTISVFNSPPTIMLISPPLNSVINGTANITVYVYDDSGIKDNQVLWRTELDEEWYNATLTDSYSVLTLDTKKYANGLIRIIVRAEDNHGNVADEVFYFTIDNPEFTSEFWGKWSNIANMISRYIFLPGVATSIVTMLLGAFVMWAITKLKQRGKQVVYVIEKKVEKKEGERE